MCDNVQRYGRGGTLPPPPWTQRKVHSPALRHGGDTAKSVSSLSWGRVPDSSPWILFLFIIYNYCSVYWTTHCSPPVLFRHSRTLSAHWRSTSSTPPRIPSAYWQSTLASIAFFVKVSLGRACNDYNLTYCVDVKWQISQQLSLIPKLLLCHWQTSPLSFENSLLWWLRHSRSKSILQFQGIFLHNPFAWSCCLHLLGNFLVACICVWCHFLEVRLYSNYIIGCQNFERVLCLILPSCLVKSVSFAILCCQSYLRECISRRGLLHYSEGSVVVLR